MIVATYVAYNESQILGESIRSVRPYVDAIVVVDTAFPENPTAESHSTDGQRLVAERAAGPLPLKYELPDRRLTQVEARNLSFAGLSAVDWALVIDGDETVLGDHAELGSFFRKVRQTVAPHSYGVKVFTSAVLFRGHAPVMTRDHYETGPIVHTRGVQPRLIRRMGVTWTRTAKGPLAPVRDGRVVKPEISDPRLSIVNHHVRQSFAGYQEDYVRETAERVV